MWRNAMNTLAVYGEMPCAYAARTCPFFGMCNVQRGHAYSRRRAGVLEQQRRMYTLGCVLVGGMYTALDYARSYNVYERLGAARMFHTAAEPVQCGLLNHNLNAAQLSLFTYLHG